MSLPMLVFEFALASMLFAAPEPAPVPDPAPAPTEAARPVPAPNPQPQPQPQPQPYQPQPDPYQQQPYQPQPDPNQPYQQQPYQQPYQDPYQQQPYQQQPYQQQPYQQQPYQQPPPPAPVPPPEPKPSDGVGLLVAGPLLVVAGVPLSFLGNSLWRDNCGPTSSTRECADGTVGSVGLHTLAGVGYGLGIGFTAMGARKHAAYSVFSGNDPEPSGFVVGGAVLLPLGLIGMGMTRLFFWLPTPDCLDYACVQRYQNYSTISVASGAVIASAGAGLLGYGIGLKRAQRRYRVSLTPRVGRDFAGLHLAGSF